MFKLYKSKLNPEINFFWQRPKQGKIHYNDPRWYDRVRVGHDPIENFMAQLSVDAKLSRRYTNHSIRSTVMGILGEHYEGRKVIGLSGHKSENTVKQYIRKLPTKTKRDMSGTLTSNILPKQPKLDKPFTFKSTKASATISKPPQSAPPEANTKENSAQVQLAPLQEVAIPQPNVEFEIQALDDAPRHALKISCHF